MNLSTITNNTCPEDGKIEELPLGIFVQVIGVLSYFLGRLGNFLLLGIVHYEKFGQDPQKRSLPDQLFTFRWSQLPIIYPFDGTSLSIMSQTEFLEGDLMEYFLKFRELLCEHNE